MKKSRIFLIFTHSSNGHYPEYVHHLYMGICDRPELEGVFVVPESFKEKRTLFNWPECSRIQFDYADNNKVGWGDGKWYKRNLRISLALRPFVKKHKPDEIFMIDPMICMPFLPFVMPRGSRISGILYGIYFYRWRELSKMRKCAEVAWNWILSKTFSRIFVLNDACSARLFNRRFHTTHFEKLPDPFLPLPESDADFRKEYHITPEQKVLFHFGSFGLKKGTLEILKSILLLTPEEKKKYVFVFAGIVQPGIKVDFYRLAEEAKEQGAVIHTFDQFCSYEFLGNWCTCCDAILVPYLLAYNSSGCIGYAAQFNKPVLGPDSGLLGRLIRSYALGKLMWPITPESLHTAYPLLLNSECDGSQYVQKNNVANFCKAVLG